MTSPDTSSAASVAVRSTHAWFEVNSGWAEPTRDALEEWFADGVCQCPDECWVAPDGVCEHGLASWWLVLRAMQVHGDLGPPMRRRLLDGAPNFRDLGGLSAADQQVVRSGVVFRSGVMDLLDDADVSRLRSLGLRTVIDLRSSEEVAQRPNRLPAGTVTHHLPVHDVSAAPGSILDRIERGEVDGLGAPMLIAGNVAFATTHAAMFATVLEVVADPANWPVVVHCTAGKDRTGFAVAALLWAIDVEHDAVVADYERTNAALADRHRAITDDARARGTDPRLLLEMLRADPAYLEAGRAAIVDHFGSVDAWFADALGIDTETRRAWRRALLEPAPTARH